MRRVYMDANATTPVLPQVVEAMRPFWGEHFGNASSIHQQGQQARAAVDHARDAIARLLRCRGSEIVFTSGGTESDNLALFGVLHHAAIVGGEKPHLITSSIEHDAIRHAAEALERQGIAEVTFLPCTTGGLIEPDSLRSALRPNTHLVSIMMANNETGVIQPIAELASIAHAAGALFHSDAVQAGGKLSMDLKGELKDIDLLSLSGHKIYAPQGTGVLFVRRNVRLAPLFHGGSHERQRRPGTENVPGIVALGRAAELAQEWLSHPVDDNSAFPTEDSLPRNPQELASLRDRLEQGILAAVPESGVNGAGAPRVCNTTNLYFDHVEAEALVIALDLKGLAVSGGSACQSGATEPSHVLTAMGLNDQRARASIRFSLSRLTTPADVDYALSLIPAAVAHLRSLSPGWNREETAIPA